MATIISSISRIVSAVTFPFQIVNFGQLVLDFEILGGSGLAGEVMDLEVFINGRSLQAFTVNRWSTPFSIIPDRRMIIVPSGFVFSPFPPTNNLLVFLPRPTVNSKGPKDFFFIGPVVIHA